jgi:hypothetical protein
MAFTHNVKDDGRCGMWRARSNLLRLDVGCPNHLRPLFIVIYDKLSEVGGRAENHRAAKIGKPRLHLGSGEGPY